MKKSALELLEEVKQRAKQRPMRVSKDFSYKFQAVASHFRCDKEEIEEMKELVRKDYENAKTSYEKMYEETK